MHAALHTLAVICVILALIAAFTSHTLKRPVPTPNLYSPHSYLGIMTVILLGAQVCLLKAFSIPQAALRPICNALLSEYEGTLCARTGIKTGEPACW